MTTISHTLLKAMLISTPGSQVNGFEVGSWWFGKSLFYRDFRNGKENIGHDLSNLTEISGSIQRQLVKWKLLTDCSDDYSNEFICIVYNLVNKYQDKFWTNGVPENVFSIPSANLDEFVSLLWSAATSHGSTSYNGSPQYLYKKKLNPLAASQ